MALNVDETARLLDELSAVRKLMERPHPSIRWRTDASAHGAVGSEEKARVAQLISKWRRKRRQAFSQLGIPGEPAWDILLDLYVRQVAHETVSVKSACLASGAPATTGLRWLRSLEQGGLVESQDDPEDLRRRYVKLSDRGWHMMGKLLDEAVLMGA